MKFKVLTLLLTLGLLVNVGCSSSSPEDVDLEMADAENSEFYGEGEEFAEGDFVDSADDFAEGSFEGEEFAGGEEFVDDLAPTDDFAADEEVVAGTDTAFDSGGEFVDTSFDSAPAEESVFEDTTSFADAPAEPAPTYDDSSYADTSYSDSSYEDTSYDDTSYSDSGYDTAGTTSYDSVSDTPRWVPVKKIATIPFTKNGVLVNAVYLARPGDDLTSISQKIWGMDNSSEILKVNPNLANAVKVGDKVYYNSPKRPQDSSSLLTYYEDNGIAAQTYVSQDGDNIRAVSKNLLGDENSWKEVWATNFDVESKAEIAGGLQLRYWPAGAVAAPSLPSMAQTMPEPVEEAPMMPEPTPDMPVADSSMDMMQDDFALPDDMATAGTMAAVEPPPPPPPPQPAQKTVASSEEKDLTFMLSAGGLLLVGVGILLGIIRKGRARKMSMNTHTQI